MAVLGKQRKKFYFYKISFLNKQRDISVVFNVRYFTQKVLLMAYFVKSAKFAENIIKS